MPTAITEIAFRHCATVATRPATTRKETSAVIQESLSRRRLSVRHRLKTVQTHSQAVNAVHNSPSRELTARNNPPVPRAQKITMSATASTIRILGRYPRMNKTSKARLKMRNRYRHSNKNPMRCAILKGMGVGRA
jgi:hypothetical protein